jgi:hypothetical protein
LPGWPPRCSTSFYYPKWSGGWRCLCRSAARQGCPALVAAAGAGIRRTRVLSPFASGADQARTLGCAGRGRRGWGCGTATPGWALRGWTCGSSRASGCCCSARPAPARAPAGRAGRAARPRTPVSPKVRCCWTAASRQVSLRRLSCRTGAALVMGRAGTTSRAG